MANQTAEEVKVNIGDIANGMDELTKGNLNYRFDVAADSEFAEICATFNRLAERLQESENQVKQQKDEMMLGITHDLGTPLTSIQAYAEGILDGVANTPEKQKHYLEMIKGKAEDIQSLVTQIFMFSELKREDYPCHPISIRMDQALNNLIETHRKDYETRGLSIHASLSDTVCLVDLEYLDRILINIAENSIKYRNNDHGNLKIFMETDDKYCTLTFQDDGPGVSEEALPHLFEVFYRTDPARSMPGKGSGIGLAIVKSLMEKLGGSVIAQNGNHGGLKIQLIFRRITS
ncbi:MAG: HAMP domain-containing histidine kinase [Lachnospiraceae bacterium]|nr:HAMP domain-containing histidine kinase [Lachnospiraceae bacterium]